MDKYETLKYYYGYSYLKPEQEMIIDSVMKGVDTIGLLPTGYGKSIAFQIPALMLDGITLVISPLIALMQDQVISLKNKGIKAEFINSLLTNEEQDIIYNKIRNNKVKLLYISAERLLVDSFIKNIKYVDISLIVFDEAHTLLWGEDFRFALVKAPEFINSLPYRPRLLALTATATSDTVNKICKYASLNDPLVIRGDVDRQNIFYEIIHTKYKDDTLLKIIKNKENIHILIYCLTIKKCIHVKNILLELGYKIDIYHGCLSSEEKKQRLIDFINHKIDIMVCTNAFGMGIDIPDIRYVILYDLPQSIEDYMQQTGRASRDGDKARAILLFSLHDIDTINYFIFNIENENISDKENMKIKIDRINKADKMIDLALSNKCIHQGVCNYFGQPHKGKCMMCSNCKG